MNIDRACAWRVWFRSWSPSGVNATTDLKQAFDAGFAAAIAVMRAVLATLNRLREGERRG